LHKHKTVFIESANIFEQTGNAWGGHGDSCVKELLGGAGNRPSPFCALKFYGEPGGVFGVSSSNGAFVLTRYLLGLSVYRPRLARAQLLVWFYAGDVPPRRTHKNGDRRRF
jgi:hypothetical protein